MWGRKYPPIAHPDWLPDACESLRKSLELHRDKRIPASIKVPMLVVPIKRVLRGVYGSSLRMALALLMDALRDIPYDFWNLRVIPFWHLKILRKTREQWMAELDAEAEAEESNA